MKPFFILFFIAFFTTLNVNAQTEVEVRNLEVAIELHTFIEQVEANSNIEIAAKKKDILNAKINSKINGEVDLFFVADKSKIC